VRAELCGSACRAFGRRNWPCGLFVQRPIRIDAVPHALQQRFEFGTVALRCVAAAVARGQQLRREDGPTRGRDALQGKIERTVGGLVKHARGRQRAAAAGAMRLLALAQQSRDV
jgi:hypothetical protein